MSSHKTTVETEKRKSSWPGRIGKSLALTTILGLINYTVFQQGNFWYESLFLVLAFLLCLLLFSAIDGISDKIRQRTESK